MSLVFTGASMCIPSFLITLSAVFRRTLLIRRHTQPLRSSVKTSRVLWFSCFFLYVHVRVYVFCVVCVTSVLSNWKACFFYRGVVFFFYYLYGWKRLVQNRYKMYTVLYVLIHLKLNRFTKRGFYHLGVITTTVPYCLPHGMKIKKELYLPCVVWAKDLNVVGFQPSSQLSLRGFTSSSKTHQHIATTHRTLCQWGRRGEVSGETVKVASKAWTCIIMRFYLVAMRYCRLILAWSQGFWQ